jgi:formate dehydrogenase major subunit
VAGLAAAFGSGAMTNSIEEIQDAECIFVIGSNTTSSHPLVATRIFRAKQKGAKLVIADPRKIQLVSEADLYMRQNLGTDAALLNGMMHVILKNNWHDPGFIEARTEGFEEFQKAVVEAYTPEKTAEITGVPAEDIIKAAEYFGTAETATIIYCMGITQHTTGVDNVKVPGEPGHAHRQYRPGVHRCQSPQRAEQRSGRLRYGRIAQCVSRISAGDHH